MLMRSKILFILSLLLLWSGGNTVFGCLNEERTDYIKPKPEVDGLTAGDFYQKFVFREDRAFWEKKRAEYRFPSDTGTFISGPNNLAVALLHLGEVKEAIKILEDWESKQPGQYFTAANLGTAYELNGENRKALDWIKEGIKRNKDAHYGTEWLHVKILEAKLALEKEPDWLDRHRVLGIDPPKNLPTDHLGQPKTLPELEDALVYQLHERLEFVKPPEPIVGQLLDDLSKVFAVKRTPEHAKAIRDLSLSYSASTEATKNGEAVTEGGNKAGGSYIFYGIIGVATVFLAGFIYVLVRQRKMF